MSILPPKMQCYREEYISTECYSNGGYDAAGGWSTGSQYEQNMIMAGGNRKLTEKSYRYNRSEAQSGYGTSDQYRKNKVNCGEYGQQTNYDDSNYEDNMSYNKTSGFKVDTRYGSGYGGRRQAYNGRRNYEDNICYNKNSASKVDTRYEGGNGGGLAVVARKGGYGAYGPSRGGDGRYYSKQQYASSGEVEYGGMSQQKMRHPKKSADHRSITYQMKSMSVSSGGSSSTTSSRSNYNVRRDYSDCEDNSGSDFEGEDSECSDGEYYDSDGSDCNARHQRRNGRAY